MVQTKTLGIDVQKRLKGRIKVPANGFIPANLYNRAVSIWIFSCKKTKGKIVLQSKKPIITERQSSQILIHHFKSVWLTEARTVYIFLLHSAPSINIWKKPTNEIVRSLKDPYISETL